GGGAGCFLYPPAGGGRRRRPGGGGGGLPQYNALNEITRERMDARFGKGYEYTYLYPGLQKVVQAAGRVIRTEQDEGVLHLLDDRFSRAEIRELLPRWWEVRLNGQGGQQGGGDARR
ncbi:helicase C-terminal domain-containing protein, partial [Variovorax sp. CT11-76]